MSTCNADAPRPGEWVGFVRTPPRATWSEDKLVKTLMERAAEGATIFVDFTKFPGPRSYNPISGFQPMTPIPATAYLWIPEEDKTNTFLTGVIQRSGFEDENLQSYPAVKVLKELWRLPYIDRVGHVDRTSLKLTLARASQIVLTS